MKTLRLFALLLPLLLSARAADLRIGIVGLDTSHAVAFTRILNDATNPGHVPGGRVVAVYRGGSADIEKSHARIPGFETELRKFPEIVFHDTIESLAASVDAVLLLSLDGRVHLDQARRVIHARKPVFIDKPLAASLRDAIAILRLAKQEGVPCFSSSSLRFNPSIPPLLAKEYGRLLGAFSYGPAELEPTHPDLFWYGIHAVESLFTVMGAGCETVVRTHTPDTDIVTGVWSDGRVGTVRGIRNARASYRVTLFGTTAVVDEETRMSYSPLVQEIITFFHTGVSPVPARDTLEIMAFMEAADESKRRGGTPVSLAEIIAGQGGIDGL